jgi:hypothetical protein
MDISEILQEVERLEKESKAFKADLMKICWYMRGSIDIDNAYSLCYEDRAIISEIIKENLETAKKTGMPFF